MRCFFLNGPWHGKTIDMPETVVRGQWVQVRDEDVEIIAHTYKLDGALHDGTPVFKKHGEEVIDAVTDLDELDVQPYYRRR